MKENANNQEMEENWHPENKRQRTSLAGRLGRTAALGLSFIGAMGSNAEAQKPVEPKKHTDTATRTANSEQTPDQKYIAITKESQRVMQKNFAEIKADILASKMTPEIKQELIQAFEKSFDEIKAWLANLESNGSLQDLQKIAAELDILMDKLRATFAKQPDRFDDNRYFKAKNYFEGIVSARTSRLLANSRNGKPVYTNDFKYHLNGVPRGK